MAEFIRRMRGKNERLEPVLDVNTIEDDMAEMHRKVPDDIEGPSTRLSLPRDERWDGGPHKYAPPAVRSPIIPLPSYVQPDPAVNPIGAATAAASIMQGENCAQEIEAMLEDLDRLIAADEQNISDAKAAKVYIAETAAAYRGYAATKFKEIEQSSKLVAEVSNAAKEMRKRIGLSDE